MRGIGYFPNGLSSPPQNAWTSDGRLVTPIVNANQVYTGTISSNNGQSWMNLNAGTGSFANGNFKWTASGAITATNMTIVGGSITISGRIDNILTNPEARVEIGDGEIRFFSSSTWSAPLAASVLKGLLSTTPAGVDLKSRGSARIGVYADSSVHTSVTGLTILPNGMHTLIDNLTIGGTLPSHNQFGQTFWRIRI